MTNGRDNLLDLPPRAPEAPDEAVPTHFESFLQQHYKGLVQFLRQRTVTEQDAEDAAQESLARLLRYRESEPARAWKPLLFRIATNVANDHMRQTRTQRQKAHVPLEEQDLSAIGDSNEPTPEQRLADQRQLKRVLAAIRNLPDKCRHVFLLSRFHGMNNHAIALRCGISVRMVEKQITKALAACRDRVRDHGA
ncbi:RNA polymerase sigma factor [Luteimonas saliphila]|uniref:RNA polymerase sigma factor n=1 Tax=Luteimonas saliphila TaxID=2804919 RepID=UPI00192E04DF|nr:sigma-70 family RNA polymerase sigma factor [Luteimonas saliphila]